MKDSFVGDCTVSSKDTLRQIICVIAGGHVSMMTFVDRELARVILKDTVSIFRMRVTEEIKSRMTLIVELYMLYPRSI